MNDGKGLDLSLGLPCSGSSSNSKEKSGNSGDVKTDKDERTSKILNDFKNFLNAGISQPFQRIDSVKPQETLFNNLSQTTSTGNVSGNGPVSGDKRKNTFDETTNQKRQETETRSSDLQDKGKTSHISITTDEGSTADNEDVADSEADGSTSRVVSQCDDGSKTPIGSGSSSQVSKQVHGKVNIGGPGSHFPMQPVSNMNVPFSITFKESPSASTSSTSYQISNMMHAIPATNGERPRLHGASPGNLPMSFGYSPIQLPAVDKDSPWGMVARPQALHSPYAGRALSTSVPTQVTNCSSSEPIRLDGHSSEQSKGQTKQVVAEEGPSSHSEDDKGRPNSFPSEYPSIRPGIAGDVKFGGSGSFPNLPWVSTTGPGPDGKTISGVTYKYNATQIKIVCACHGIHMSPDEFIQHTTEDQAGASRTPGLASIPSSNPAASAKS